MCNAGMTPHIPKVWRYHAKYSMIPPANPKNPRVNDSEPHGPSGAQPETRVDNMRMIPNPATAGWREGVGSAMLRRRVVS